MSPHDCARREIHEERDYSDKVAEDIDDEVHSFIQQAHSRAQEILVTYKDKLIEIAEYLGANETVEGEELNRLFDGPPPLGRAVPTPEPEPSPVMPPSVSPAPRPSPSMPIRHNPAPHDSLDG